MVGCSGAQIKVSVKAAIRLPANDSLERDIPELQSKTLKTWQKGVSRGQKAAGRHTRWSPCSTLWSRAARPAIESCGISAHKRAPAENRRTAMKKGQPKLAVVDRRCTMGLKEKRQ